MQQREPTEKTWWLINPCTNYLVSTQGYPKKNDGNDLIQAIKETSMTCSAADPRGQSEVINSWKNLDDLTKDLNNSGFDLSCSSVYLLLILHKRDSIEGKQHKKVTNVKLCRVQSMQQLKNLDWCFVAVIIKHVEDLALLMWENNVAILGQDGIPDHIFVVASKHAHSFNLCI